MKYKIIPFFLFIVGIWRKKSSAWKMGNHLKYSYFSIMLCHIVIDPKEFSLNIK